MAVEPVTTTPREGVGSADAARNAARPGLPANWEMWNDRHAGATVYVVGASPQLASLTAAQVAGLSRAVVIGGNNTFYKAPLTYFLSAYPLEVHKAGLHLPAERLLHMRLPSDPELGGGINSVNRLKFDPRVGLTRWLSEPLPGLYTLRNQALGMLHLAIVMGARRVAFIGVDQSNYAYFWQYDDAIRQTLRRDMHRLQSRYRVVEGSKDREKYFDAVYDLLGASVEDRVEMPFYEDFVPTFREYFAEAARHGVEIVATLKESVIERAGARYLPLDECLATPPTGQPATRTALPTVLTATRPTAIAARAPLLFAGLGEHSADLLGRLRAAGLLLATPDTSIGEAATEAWCARSGRLLGMEPLWDHPEAAVALPEPSRFATHLRAQASLGADAGAGWSAPFDLTVFPALDHAFPGIRLIYDCGGDRREVERALVEECAAKLAAAAGATPARQMEILDLRGSGRSGPRLRFTRRCATAHGARTLLDTYARMAQDLLQQFGPDRVLRVEHRAAADVSAILDWIGGPNP